MILIVNDIFKRGACFRPFIILPKWTMNMSEHDRKVVLAHYSAYYAMQERCFPILWVLKFFLSNKFRVDALVRAYAFEIVVQKHISDEQFVEMTYDHLIHVTASWIVSQHRRTGKFNEIKTRLSKTIEEIKDKKAFTESLEETVRYSVVVNNQGA